MAIKNYGLRWNKVNRKDKMFYNFFLPFLLAPDSLNG